MTNYDKSDYLFKGLKEPIEVGHYHSWHLDKKSISDSIKITAESDGIIMALSHQQFDVKGLQFHPESILTTRREANRKLDSLLIVIPILLLFPF